jgi:hypothetical protein
MSDAYIVPQRRTTTTEEEELFREHERFVNSAMNRLSNAEHAGSAKYRQIRSVRLTPRHTRDSVPSDSDNDDMLDHDSDHWYADDGH